MSLLASTGILLYFPWTCHTSWLMYRLSHLGGTKWFFRDSSAFKNACDICATDVCSSSLSIYVCAQILYIVVGQSLSYVWSFATPWTAAHQASLSFSIFWSFLKFMSIESVMPSNHLILCCGVPFSSRPQSFTASGSFPVSQLFATDAQSIRASASALPVNIQGWFPLWLTDLTSLPSRGLSRVFSSTTIESINYLALSLFYGSTLTSVHDY